MFRRELKLIKKRREGEVSRIKLKFGLTNVQGVDNSKGQSAADKIIVVSYVSWSISLNGWMQPNEARRRITSTPYLSSFRLNIAGRSVFRLENRPFSATFDINYISFLFHFHSLYLRYSYFYIYYLYNTISIIICTYNFPSPLLKKFFPIFFSNFYILDAAARRDKKGKKIQTSK